jgi:hypothetical protein
MLDIDEIAARHGLSSTGEDPWYMDESKRREVVVRFLERRVNQSLRPVQGSFARRRAAVLKTLRARGRGMDYLRLMQMVEMRAAITYSHAAIARRTQMKKGTVKQTLRRLDSVARELFSPMPPETVREKNGKARRPRR